MNETRETIEVRVANGIATLDERGPDGWRALLDLDRLDIGNQEDCVVGQLYRPYPSIGYDTLGGETITTAAALGLIPYAEEPYTPTSALLTAEWKRQLA